MKKYLYTLLLLVPMVFTSCDDDDVNIVNVPSAQGSVMDDMGNTYNWVRIGNLDWTTSNALNGESMLYAEYIEYGAWTDLFLDETKEELKTSYIPYHGNLMDFEEAVASAPDGWRLPSDEDWKNLERALGMSDADAMGWRGAGVAARLMDKGGVGLGFTFGGNIRSILDNSGLYSFEFDSVDEAGYYWTSTINPSYDEEPTAYFRKLVNGVGGVERRCTSAESRFSVRWCRNATNN